jgi:hypothetical protein
MEMKSSNQMVMLHSEACSVDALAVVAPDLSEIDGVVVEEEQVRRG